MPKLPRLSGIEIIKVLSKVGFYHSRTTGSHAILNKEISKGKITVVVPLHHEVAKGTFKSILKQAGLTLEEFLKL